LLPALTQLLFWAHLSLPPRPPRETLRAEFEAKKRGAEDGAAEDGEEAPSKRAKAAGIPQVGAAAEGHSLLIITWRKEV
jgi:hypothetical protein